MGEDRRRRTPRTDVVLDDPAVAARAALLGRARTKAVVVEVLARCRSGALAPEAVVPAVLKELGTDGSLRPVVNATGVVVHTNLGRAPLSAAAVRAVQAAAGACDVELDLATGRRGPRGEAALAALRRAVPDAGDVHVVNNGAAALGLVALGLAAGREVVVPRGEMVEIGDGFRIPDLVASTGARLREVGTTNRVRVEDYADAIGPDTAMLLKVHPSNFRVEGLTSTVEVPDLATLGERTGIPVVADIGSGLLARHPRLPDEPDAGTALRAGASLVTASGDKLLGGPQCGLLLGDATLVARLRRHPFARALRVDKLTLAALEATLAGPPPPVAEALGRSRDSLIARADAIVAALADDAGADAGPVADVVLTEGRVGGGGAPGVVLASAGVALSPRYAAALREGERPVVGHVHDGRLVLDLLAVDPSDDATLVEAVRAVRKADPS